MWPPRLVLRLRVVRVRVMRVRPVCVVPAAVGVVAHRNPALTSM